MEKIFKILIVFILLMFLITYFIRSRDRKFREFIFSHRIPDTPPAEDEPPFLSSIISHLGIASITDAAAGIVYNYTIDGTLTIYRENSLKVLQRLAVPQDGYYLTVDPVKEEVHLHHEGEIYIYKRSPAA
jgi:hypothetical protein